MSRSSDRRPRVLALSVPAPDRLLLGYALLAAATLCGLLAFLAGPAHAGSKPSIVVSSGDTTRVREIRIDDEGIRVTGPGDRRVLGDGSIVISGNGDRVRRRFRHVFSDTLGEISVRTGSDNEIVQFFKDVHVQKGQVAGQVVAILGNVRNDGVISGDCVSVLGSVVLGDSAVIQGEAVSVGGSVHSDAPGAHIDGGTTSVGFMPFSTLSMPSSALLILFGLVSLLLSVLLSALVARLFPERTVRIAETISQRTFLSLVLGLLSLPLAIMLGLLLAVTVIGVPLAILLPFLYVLAAFFGFTAAVYLLGGRLIGRRPSTTGGMLGPIAAGSAFVTLFYLVGVPLMAAEGGGRIFGIGFFGLWIVIGTVCWMLGLGALLLSRIGQAPAAAPAAPGAPPVPPGYAARPIAPAPPPAPAPPAPSAPPAAPAG
jgi:hypothetical protein